jgi:hypothetical protein
MNRLSTLTAAVLTGAMTLFADAGSWTVVGGNMEFASTIAAVGLGKSLFVVASDGALYTVDAKTGIRKQMGKKDFIKTKHIFAVGNDLVTIDKSGTLFRISTADGSSNQVNKSGNYANSIAAVGLGGKLYIVESSGALSCIDPVSGSSKQIGKSDFSATKFMFTVESNLIIIDKEGTCSKVSMDDGSMSAIGQAGDWGTTIAGVGLNDKLYTIDGTGALYVTNPLDASWSQIGRSEYANTKFMCAVNNKLLTIENTGTMYAIDID